MMKKFYLFLLTLLVALTASAERVSEQQAFQKARYFLKGKQLVVSPAKVRGRGARVKDSLKLGYYVFNAANNDGFVIIASDDRMPEVLGYSEHGSLVPETAPCNVKWLLEYYNKVAASFDQPGTQARAVARAAKPAVRPLVTTKWDQGAPYNDQCPELNGVRCITGCVATAMAQVINYNRWPQGQTTGVPAYVTNSSQISVPALGPTQFNWDNMTNDDVARLMRYCGQSVQMDYGLNDSGAFPNNEPAALRKVFGYDPSVHYVEHARYNDEDWEDLLYNELAEQRPVIFNGFGEKGGHTFVVHGYKDGMFYINWGWSGNEDGYFKLTGLNTSVGDYSGDQSATISIKAPAGSTVSRPALAVNSININSERYMSRNEGGTFPSMWISGSLDLDLNENKTVDIGVGLYDDKGLKAVLWEESRQFIVGEGYWFNAGFDIDSDIADGEYRIVPICRDGNSNWVADANSSSCYVEAVIKGKWLMTRAFPLSYDERYMEDMGIQVIDGIIYNPYVLRGEHLATVFRGDVKYKGDIYVPDVIKYQGVEYRVDKVANNAFSDCPELTSLSLGVSELPEIGNCQQLKTLELREGVVTTNYLGNFQILESIEYPASVSRVQVAITDCSKLKTIRFKNPYLFTFGNTPNWNSYFMPALTDVYFASPEAPNIQWLDGNVTPHPSATIHVPNGSKADYEAGGWSGWKIVDDQPVPETAGVVWGYNESNNVGHEGVTSNYGQNDAEYAIRVPAEALAPYKGKKITQIQFYQCGNAYEYAFVTKPGTDYLMKQAISPAVDVWNRIVLSEPYTITGEDLFVGVGRHGEIGINWCDPNVISDNVWARPMGTDTGGNMQPGEWIHLADMGFNHPIPIRFVISGENMPVDVALSGMTVTCDEARYSVEGRIENRSMETVKSVTINWDIDGKWKGKNTLDLSLRSSRTETFSFGLDANITGHDHQLSYSVSEVNGSQDAVASNSTGTVAFKSPANTQFPRKVVMEEGTGTWCGWCVRGIETIDRLRKQYPVNFIAIGLHTGDEMENPENYDQIVSQFESFPGSMINRSRWQDPDYPRVLPLVEDMKDLAEAKIGAVASYSTRDSSAVTVFTETVFGFDNTGADYRIAYVVVEDHVGPYVQNNYYSGNPYGEDDYMYEWAQKAAKVKIEFNDVARGIYPNANGLKGSVPSTVKEGESYDYSYSFNLPKKIQNKDNIRIIVLLIDNKTGEIVNADESMVFYDGSIDDYTYGFAYQNETIADNAIVTIDAEEDEWGFDEMNCETNPSSDPKGGLILTTFDKSQKSGKATLEILSNTLDAKQIQWCMGGECVPMNGKTKLEKDFTTDKDGIALVQFDATGIQSKGQLEALLATTIGEEKHTVKIVFVYDDPMQEPTAISYRGNQLLTNKKYTSADFSDIKSGSFKISKDGSTLTLTNIDVDCKATDDDGCLFQFDRDATIKLTGDNKLRTQGYLVGFPYRSLTITGGGSLTTSSTWYDFRVYGNDFTIDHASLICEGGVAIGNNMMPSGDNIVVKNATFKGHRLFRLSSLVLINSDFVSSKKIIYDPGEINGNQLKYEDGTYVYEFDIEPVEGDYANRVTPSALGNVYLEVSKSRAVNVLVQNNGTAAVQNVSYVVEIDGVAKAEETYKLPDAVNRIGATFDLPVMLTGDYQASVRQINLTVTKVNGVENSSPDKMASGLLYTVAATGSHSVVVEEFTGSWCGWCTRGIVGLNMLNNTFGDKVITVAAHGNDPMSVSDYGFIFNRTNSFPSCIINRGELIDPYYGSSKETPFGIEADVMKVLSVPVVGSVEVQALWTDAGKTNLKMTAKTTFGVNDDHPQYQIGFLLLADGLKGSGSDWAQNNVYAGWNAGDANFNSIANLPGVITNMEYDHVAIAAWGAEKGLAGSVYAPIHADSPQTFTYEHSIAGNSLVQDKDKLYIVALLLDKNTGKIINAAKAKVGEANPNAITVIRSDGDSDVWYDLNGNRLDTPPTRKGVYIRNGKKVVR